MSEQKQLLTGAAILFVVMAICFVFLIRDTGNKPDQTTAAASPLDSRVVILDEANATIKIGDDFLAVPAPETYCFADPRHQIDSQLIQFMQKMQRSYGNHLWLAFVNCTQLADARKSNDVNAYIDTGMILTPEPFIEKKMPDREFSSRMKEQVGKLDPIVYEDLMNDATKKNFSSAIDISSGRPVILSDKGYGFIFMLKHHLTQASQAAFDLTEFNIITSLRDHPMAVIFSSKNLEDPVAGQEFIEDYLEALRNANAASPLPAPAR